MTWFLSGNTGVLEMTELSIYLFKALRAFRRAGFCHWFQLCVSICSHFLFFSELWASLWWPVLPLLFIVLRLWWPSVFRVQKSWKQGMHLWEPLGTTFQEVWRNSGVAFRFLGSFWWPFGHLLVTFWSLSVSRWLRFGHILVIFWSPFGFLFVTFWSLFGLVTFCLLSVYFLVTFWCRVGDFWATGGPGSISSVPKCP